MNNTENSREFFITMQVQFPDADNTAADKNYNVKIRFVSENQQWLIDYLTIEETNTLKHINDHRFTRIGKETSLSDAIPRTVHSIRWSLLRFGRC